MACGCAKIRRLTPPPVDTDGSHFGEFGLTKIVCSEDCGELVGEYTGVHYHFESSQTLYVDKRDVPFLLRPGVDYAS